MFVVVEKFRLIWLKIPYLYSHIFNKIRSDPNKKYYHFLKKYLWVKTKYFLKKIDKLSI